MFRSVVTGGLGLALFLSVSVDEESPNEFMDTLARSAANRIGAGLLAYFRKALP